MTETRRQTRLRELTNTLNRTVAQREGCIASLVRYEARLLKVRKQLARLERAMAAPKPAPVTVPAAVAPQAQPVPAYQPGMSLASQIDDVLSGNGKLDDAIPAFLDRRKAADAKDAETRAKIEQQNAARKRTKSQVRIERMKAKQSGATRKMPLTGKAALAHIKAAG